MKNLNLSSVTSLAPKVIRMISNHAVFGFILLFSALAGYVIVQSSTIITAEPTEEELFDAALTVQRSDIDEDTLNILEELTSRNISLESLFVERQNPFE